ncbi:MAG: hypothetical protein ACRDUS_09740 [Mycobacterium sp.]
MWIRRGLVTLMILLVATGCTRTVSGQARGGEPAPGVDSLFGGDLPDYGQKLDEDERATLTYARALRRVDPCGFAESLKGIGEVGAYFGNLDGCTVPVKVSGADETWVDMNLVLDDVSLLPPAFTVGSVPVYDSTDACSFRMVLPLPKHRATGKEPVLKVSDYWADLQDAPPHCDLIKSATTLVAKGLPSSLQVRHSLSAYPIKLAQRDPCEVLAEYPGQARDIAPDSLGSPFGCDFTLGNLDYSVQLIATAKNYSGYQHEERDGITYFYYDKSPGDPLNCHAIALVGDAMYGKDRANGSVRTADGSDPYYPAISVSSFPEDTAHCGQLREILDKAVRIFANSAR